MKYIYTHLLLFFTTFCFSQLILNTKETTSRTVSDPTVIYLLPGFSANAVEVDPFIAKIGISSTPISNNGTTTPVIINPTGTQSGSASFHDTQGKLEVSSGGQATFTLPIAMPPSLQGVGPVINLNYSSGQGGGIAGQGWSINSISTIARMATRLDIEGFVDGVDFDDNDKLALDGQRLLIKNGVYWQVGSIYETEVQSNTKIELKTSGSALYFIVTLSDGSKNYYGNYNNANASDKTAFYISRFEDVNGNFMVYDYFKPFGKSLCLNTIQFSANINSNVQPLNKIQFFYDNAKRFESAYIHGEKIDKVEILKKIEVTTNNLLFKRYEITHVPDPQLGYERVSKIQEFNNVGEVANPIEFTYDKTTTEIAGSERVKTFTNNFNFNDTKTAGDFDGDGHLDFATDSHLYIKAFEGSNGTAPIAINTGGDERTRIIANTLKYGKLIQKQSFIVAEETVNAINFKYYSLNDSSSNLLLDNIKSVPFDNSISNSTPGTGGALCEIPDKKSSNKYLEGDFNGDGLSEILIISTINEKYSVNNVEHDQPEQGYFPYCTVTTDADTQTTLDYFFLNLDPNGSNVLSTRDYVKIGASNILKGDKRFVMDFNGDGKSDILLVNNDKTYKVVGIKTLPAAPWMEFETIGEGVFDDYNDTKPLLFGDYNGDGKIDAMLPTGDGVLPGQNLWNIYFCNPKLQGGSLFEKQTYPIVEYWPNSGTYFSLGQQFASYYALDTNKDGKSDLVRVWRNKFKPKMTINNHDTNWQVTTYANNIGNTARGSGFTSDYITPCQGNIYTYSCDHWSDSPELVVPIVSKFRHAGINNELVIIRKHTNELTYINFSKDVSIDNNLIKVSQSNGAIIDEIKYKSLDTNPNVNNGLNSPTDFYSSTNELLYPLVELRQLPTTKLVENVTNTVMGVKRQQDFKYHGFAVKLNGLGTIGFKKTARSSWYNMNTGKKTFAVTVNDPTKRGATVKTYSQLLDNNNSGNFNDESNKLSQIDYEYEEPNIGNKYAILLKKQTTHDLLSNVKTTSETEYTADYFLPRLSTSKNYVGNDLQGTSISESWFDTNITGIGSNYYIGRPTKTIATTIAYGDTKTSSQQFFYTNGNVTRTEKKANNAPETIVEEALYFNNGNLKSKTLSALGTNSTTQVSPRTTQYTYDPSNRFIKTTTDIELLLSTINSYHPIYGVVLQETNPYGLTTTSEYDNWGKRTKITDFLGKSVNYQYARTGNIYKTIESTDDGSSSIVESDALARVFRSGSKNMNNIWIYKNTEYDALGRKFKESEPYFGTDTPSQWNTTLFDDYGRTLKVTAFTGRTVTATYNGLTTSSNDEVTIKSVTKNANGHTISTTDNPGGTINFSYNADGTLKNSNFGGVIMSMTYDAWGRKTELNDPSAGLYKYGYNAFGETISESTPKGLSTYILNQATGKLMEKTIVGDLTNSKTTYIYDGLTKLLKQSDFQDLQENVITNYTYGYDNKQRLIATVENNPTATFTNEKSYDGFGRVEIEYYNALHKTTGKSSAKHVKNVYKNGFHWQILNLATNQVLWQANNANAKGQLTSAILGNGITIANSYDQYGYNTQTAYSKPGVGNGNILTLNTNFEPKRGNLMSRSSNLFNISETFEYDSLDRLTKFENIKIRSENNFNSEIGTFDNTAGILTLVDNKLKIELPNSTARVRKLLTTTAIVGQKYSISAELNSNAARSSYYIYEAASTVANAPQVMVPVAINSSFVVSTYPNIYIEFYVNDYDNCQDIQNCSTEYDEYGLSYQNCITERVCEPIAGSDEITIDNLNLYEYIISNQSYDALGRIDQNSVGNYKYANTSKPFQNTSVGLNADASTYYQNNRNNLDITYNAFKSPVDITEVGKDKLSFVYNMNNDRSSMYYGNLDPNKLLRTNRKHYSADGAMEIKHNIITGAVEFITYIGGDAYSAPIVLKSDGITQQYLYLHRDYLGSIVAITNQTAEFVEKRHFDAWGNVDRVSDGAGTALNSLTVIDRGYTGHEHLQSVVLIHMNGRLYDPLFHRFLQPDNFVQDPFNTQNYNRYSYVLNNPLKYNDPSGEIIPQLAVAVIIGVGVAMATYTLTALLADVPFTIAGLAKTAAIAAFTSAVTFGIGQGTAAIKIFAVRATVQSLAHGTFNGMMSGVQGGNFWNGFAAGAISSAAASLWAGGTNHDGLGASGKQMTHYGGYEGFGSFLGAEGVGGMIAFGTIAGGAGAALTGGNFWQGAVTGLMVSGLNHAMDHGDDDPIKNYKKKIAINNDKILLLSAFSNALNESTTYGEFLSGVRNNIVAMYGNKSDQVINEKYDNAVSLMREFKNDYKIPDTAAFALSTRAVLSILGIEGQNMYYNAQIARIENMQAIKNLFHGTNTNNSKNGFHGGFGGGSFSGSGASGRFKP